MPIISDWDAVSKVLHQPFPASVVKALPGVATKDGTKALSMLYVDARAVAERLDAAVGPGNWDFGFEVLHNDLKHMVVKGRLTIGEVTREDVGEGKTTGLAGENACKGAVSDALKRCAVLFGVGAYFYRMPQLWLAFDNQKKKFIDEYPYERELKRAGLKT